MGAKYNYPLIINAIIVNLLSIVTGISYAWSSPVLPKLYLNDTDINPLGTPINALQESWIASFLSLGAFIGPILGAFILPKLGRKQTLLLTALPMGASYVILAYARTLELYYFARLLLGIGAGCVYSTLPAYVGEIAEDSNRGALGCLLTFMGAIGNVIGFALGPYLSIQNFCLSCLIPLGLFLVLFWLLAPESPYHLIYNGRIREARLALSKIRQENIDKELEIINHNVEATKMQNKISLREILNSPSIKRGLLIGLGLMFFQQGSGICVIISYSQLIFEAASSGIPSDISTIIVGLVQLISNFITFALIEKAGRKIFLLCSLFGALLAHFGLALYFYLKQNNFSSIETINWLPIASVILYLVFFNLGLGPVVWSMMGELFPTNFKSLATTSTTIFCLMLAFMQSLFYPNIIQVIGIAQVYFIYSGLCGLGGLFVIFMVPETKGKSLREIQELLGGHRK